MAKNPNEGLKGPCETITGWDHEDGYDRMPTGIKCHRPGRWRPYGLMPYGTILCDDCYVTFLLKLKEKDNDQGIAGGGGPGGSRWG